MNQYCLRIQWIPPNLKVLYILIITVTSSKQLHKLPALAVACTTIYSVVPDQQTDKDSTCQICGDLSKETSEGEDWARYHRTTVCILYTFVQYVQRVLYIRSVCSYVYVRICEENVFTVFSTLNCVRMMLFPVLKLFEIVCCVYCTVNKYILYVYVHTYTI